MKYAPGCCNLQFYLILPILNFQLVGFDIFITTVVKESVVLVTLACLAPIYKRVNLHNIDDITSIHITMWKISIIKTYL